MTEPTIPAHSQLKPAIRVGISETVADPDSGTGRILLATRDNSLNKVPIQAYYCL